MMDHENSHANGWEAAKENVLPLKRGRATKGLAERVDFNNQGSDICQENESAKDIFEKELLALKNKEGHVGLELLTTYVKYLKWTRDSFPSSKDKALQLLERCTFELKEDEKLKNEPQFVKIWIEYADLVRTPGEIFSFMSTNKIGEKVALFWIAWAFVAEKANNFKLTDQIFQKGIRRLAEPKDLLQKRYQQFQRRLARHYLNSDQSDESAVTQAIISDPESNKDKERKALSALTSGQISSSRVRSSNSSNSSAANTSAIATNALSSSSRQSKNAAAPAPFKIFSSVDSNDSNSVTSSKAGSWKNLGTENERNRENSGPVTKWTEAPLMVPPSLPMQQPVALSSFIPIFVDESFSQNMASSKSSAPTPMDSSVGGRKPGLKIRDQLDKPVATGSVATADSDGNERIENIAKNPLHRHTQQQQQQSEVVKDDPVAIPRSSLPISAPMDVPRKAISVPEYAPTTSKSAHQKGLLQENPIVSNGLGFSIFSDASVSTIQQPSAPKDSSKLADEKRSKPSSKQDGKPKIIPQSQKIESQSLGFTIFSDSQPPMDASKKGGEEKQPKEKKRPLLAPSSMVPATTGGDIKAESSALSRPFAPIEVSTSAQELLSQSFENIAEYDAEDSTINTKLARHDIDSMFCSPSAIDHKHKPSTNSSLAANNYVVKASIRDPGHHQQKQLPLGMKVEELTGIKDISAIKEMSHDSSVLNGSHFMSTPSLQPGRSKTLSSNMCQSEFGGEFQSERCREELGDEDRKGYSSLSLYTSSHSSTSMDSDVYNGVDDDVLIPKRRKMLISSVSPSFSAAVLASIFSPEPLLLSSTTPQSAQREATVLEGQDGEQSLSTELVSSAAMCVDDAVVTSGGKDGEFLGDVPSSVVDIAEASGTIMPIVPEVVASDCSDQPSYTQKSRGKECGIDVPTDAALEKQSISSGLPSTESVILDEGKCLINFIPFSSELFKPISTAVVGVRGSAISDGCCSSNDGEQARTTVRVATEQPSLLLALQSNVDDAQGTVVQNLFEEPIDFCSEEMFEIWSYDTNIAATAKKFGMFQYGRVEVSNVSDCSSRGRRTADCRRSLSERAETEAEVYTDDNSKDLVHAAIGCMEGSIPRPDRCTETVTEKEYTEPTMSPMEIAGDDHIQTDTTVLDVASFERNKYIYSWDQMMQYLHENYSDTRGGATSIWDLSNSSIPDALMRRKQVCSNRSKNITLTQIPGPNISLVVLACVGVGSFGRAVLAKVKASNSERSISRESLKHWGEYKVLKVDRDQKSVIWEIYIQAMIHMRTEIAAVCGKEEFHDSMWQRYYQNHFFPFDYLFLYENSAVVSMPFGDMGTLFNALKIIHSSVSANQHEFIVAFIVKQMLDVLTLLTKIGIIHCDIKLDNWVLKRNDSPKNTWDNFRVVMIDFGKAKATATSHYLCSGDGLSLEYSSTISAGLDEIYADYVSSCASTVTSEVGDNTTHSGAGAGGSGGRDGVRYYNYIGSESAKCSVYEEQCKSKPWSHQLDYFGVAKCAHQLLFMAPLSPILETVERAMSRGYEALPTPTICATSCSRTDIDIHIIRPNDETPIESVFVPSATIKRYWNGPLWGSFFYSLLNGWSRSNDVSCRLRELNLLSGMFAEHIGNSFSDSIKQAATNIICEKLSK